MIGLILSFRRRTPRRFDAAPRATRRSTATGASRDEETLRPHRRPSTTSRCRRTSSSHYLDKRVRYILEPLPPGRGLDVGCGTGVLAGALADAGYEMTGVDPSQGMLDVLAERRRPSRRCAASGTELPVRRRRFDLALTRRGAAPHRRPGAVRQTLAEMVRVARPGGRRRWSGTTTRATPTGSRLMARVPQDDGTERLVPEARDRRRPRARRGRVLTGAAHSASCPT